MFALLPSSVAIAPPSPRAPQPVDPSSWISAADYPAGARGQGMEGAVSYRVDVDARGNPVGCQITLSAGPLLDQPTCDLLMRRSHFKPAMDGTGKTVAGAYVGRIRWQMPPRPVAPPILTVGKGAAVTFNKPFGLKPVLPAQPVFEATPDPVEDPAAGSPPADPRVVFGQLPNGLRYAILANNTPRGAVSFRLRVGVGSADEMPGQGGYAHLVEHMMFRGSTNVPDGEFERSLEQMGLAMGSDTTAFTYPETTVYGLDFPPAAMSTTATGLFLLREIADRAQILPAPLAIERGVVLSEKRVRDTAALRMENARLDFLLPGLAVARPTVGAFGTISNATADGLRDFYHRYYRPERSVLIVVGNLVPADVEADIKARFSDWNPAAPAPPLPSSEVRARGADVRIFTDRGASRYARIDWQSPYDARPDSYARQADYLADTLAFEILNDRFLRAAAAPDAPFASASAGGEALFHAAMDTSIGVRPVEGKLRPAVTAMIVEQKRLVRYGVSRAEYDRAVARIRARLAEGAGAAETRGSSDIANALVQGFDSNTIFVSPRQNQADVERLLQSMSVANVDRAAKRLFSGSGPLLFVSDTVMPEGGAVALKATLTAAMAAPVTARSEAATVTWPYTDFGPPGRIVERKELADLGVTVARFANGTTATVRPTPGTGQVLFNLAFGAGMGGLPEGRDHALWLLSQAPQTFALGGLGKADLADINDALFGKNVGASLVSTQDRFHLTGRTRPEDMEAEAQLLTAYLVDPAYRARALRDAISGIRSARTQLGTSVPLTAARDTAFLLHDRDPRWRGTPSEADIKATTNGDLPALIGPSLAGPINMVIVGDMDVERAIRVAQATVGALPPRGPRPATRDFRFPAPQDQPVVEIVPGAAQQGMAIAAWPTASFTSSMENARAIQVLSEVIKARLMAGLRERDGLTYSPDTFVDQAVSQLRYAVIGAQVELPPDKAGTFFVELDAIVQDLAKTPIKPDELARARTPMVDNSRRYFAFADYWADALAGSDSDPAYFQMIRTKLPDLIKVTPADVQRMAQLYLTSRKPFRFVVRPGAPVPVAVPRAAARAARRP